MIRSLAITSVVVSILAVACGGSDVTVGTTGSNNEKLQTQQNGAPTGDGSTCSWAGTSVYASVYGSSSASVVVPTYALGDDFKSIDGCNECQCTAQGIMCTVNVCAADAGPVACPALARICNDGSTAVAGPDCSLHCPEDGTVVACAADAKKCPDGSYVARVAPKCDFAACGTGPTACPALAKACPDGSYVTPSGPNCTFPDCPPPTTPPSTCNDLTTAAQASLTAAIGRDSDCAADTDCVAVIQATSCSPGCSVVIAKAGESDWNTTKAQVETDDCTKFKAQDCQLEGVACSNIAIVPRCTNKKCSGAPGSAGSP